MDIEAAKLIIEITVLPCIGLISSIVVVVFGAWTTFQFSKSLENYKRGLTSENSKISIPLSEPKSPQGKIVSNEKGETDLDLFVVWIFKVMFRGATALINLAAFITGTLLLFIIIRPFGTKFIYNRINDLIKIPPLYQLYYEISQSFSIELLTTLFLLVMSTFGGFLAALITSTIISVVFWVLDIEYDS
jgi:hypothetical protein